MSNFSTFVAMGGYGAFVWPAYGLAVLAFAISLAWTVHTLKARRREEQALSATGRERRSRRKVQS